MENRFALTIGYASFLPIVPADRDAGSVAQAEDRETTKPTAENRVDNIACRPMGGICSLENC